MKSFIVYKHVFPNGKVYIGITCCDPSIRWKSGHGYDNQPVMKNAIDKYGWENVKHEVIAENLTKEKACEMEVELIRKYNSTNRNNGYNVTLGGESYEMTEEHKKKIGAANKGRPSHLKGLPMSESRKKKIGLSNRGKKRTAEQRKAQSEYMKKYAIGDNNPRARKVRCVETGAIFGSVKTAAEWANVARTTLSDTLNGRSNQCGGFRWEYIN